MTTDLANDLAYLEGQVSAALRHDAGRKLKCKEGYVQRGNACQKASGKKPDGNNLARNIGAGLGVAALVGGAAAIAAKSNKNPSPTPTQSRPTEVQTTRPETLSDKTKRRLLIGGLSVAATGGAIAATNKGRALSSGSNASGAAEEPPKETVPQVLIRRRVKDLNNPEYIKNSTEILNEFASKPKVAEAVSTFLFPEFNAVSKEDAKEKKAKASKVIISEVMTNPKARRAAIKYGTGLASEWAKDPEMRRIAGGAVAKTVSGPKDESQLSPFQKILRRSERDSILLGAAISLAIKKRSLKGVAEEATVRANTTVQRINENRDSGELSDAETLDFFYSLYTGGSEKRADAGRKLKCKEGYIQRGNACQKIGEKKPSDNNLARNIGAGLGAAALVGGAAAIASRGSKQSTSEAPTLKQNPESPRDRINKILADKKVRTAAIAAGTASAVVAGYVGANSLDKKYQIQDKALQFGLQQSIALGGTVDKALDNSSLNEGTKKQAKELIGMTKLAFARKILVRGGNKLVNVDKKSNSFTYQDGGTGGVVTLASVGPALFSFVSQEKKQANMPNTKIYDISFQINMSHNKKESANLGASGAKQIIKLTKDSFDKHVEALPDNSLLMTSAFDKDGSGKKRQNIYEKVGFGPMEGEDPKALYAAKKNGRFYPIAELMKLAK
jgi:hypothetical protein